VKKLFVFFLLLSAGSVFCGDIASFQNLGFSEDGRYFMFGQYGILEESLKHYAQLYVVDVGANKFVSDGILDVVYEEELEPGQSGISALFTLYQEAGPLVSKYRVNHMFTGRLLYILINGREPKSSLEFKDFIGGKRYEVDLLQSTFGPDDNVSAAFHINLSVIDDNGTENHFIVGLPDYRRKGVRQYKIRQILLGPDEASLVLIVEKEETAGTGVDIRYMVETVTIR